MSAPPLPHGVGSDRLGAAVAIDRQRGEVSSRIGLARCAEHGHDALSRSPPADQAMSRALREGRDAGAV